MSKIITCLIVDDERLAQEVVSMHLSNIENIKVVAECENALEAFNYISTQTIDLIFLDINMPDISGISFAKSINKDIKIIFTTAYREYAVDGFELEAVDYLLKPISFERLLKAVNTYFKIHTPLINKKLTSTGHMDFIFVRSDRKMIKIDFNAMVYIESYSDYIKIHLEKRSIVTRETLSVIEAKLPKELFIRIHRSFIVSIKNIESFTNEHVVIKQQVIPVSRSYKKEVLRILEQYQ